MLVTPPSHHSLEERLLLQEITHRVNNEFASMIQVVSSKAAKSPDCNVKAVLAGVMEQLHNYARVHHALQMPTSNDRIDASEYLRDLCRSISQSKLESQDIELLLVEEKPFMMPSGHCWTLGMIVVELITNAVRHAFHQRIGGTIQVECRASREFVECRVSDNGSASSEEARPGSGLKIIDALAKTLGAGLRFNFAENGSEAIVVFPLEHESCDKIKPRCDVAATVIESVAPLVAE
jgi:two-component sensor histidine kinase